jgi:membrane protease YdiL (CAAX protease family)
LPGAFTLDPILELRSAGASTGTIFLLVCVTPPVLEEAAFRGVIFEKIHQSFGTRPAAIVIAILFSVLHLALLSFVPLAALALVLAAVRIRTGSLWPAIAGHALFNLTTMLFEANAT